LCVCGKRERKNALLADGKNIVQSIIVSWQMRWYPPRPSFACDNEKDSRSGKIMQGIWLYGAWGATRSLCLADWRFTTSESPVAFNFHCPRDCEGIYASEMAETIACSYGNIHFVKSDLENSFSIGTSCSLHHAAVILQRWRRFCEHTKHETTHSRTYRGSR
jgi:hypothetical protein